MISDHSLPAVTVKIRPEWIDYNGHLNVAYYVLAFDQATEYLYGELGIRESYVAAGFSLFTLAMNVDYLRELFVGEAAVITSQLLDADHKRLHYMHQMVHQKSGELAATNECLAINVDMASRRSTPFPDEIHARIQAMVARHGAFPRPPQAGRQIGIRRP